MFEQIPSLSEIFSSMWNILKTNEFAQGGALISFLMALPRYILPWFKQLWERIERRIIYIVHIEETDEMFKYLELYLQKNHTNKYRNVEAVVKFDSDTHYDIITEQHISTMTEEVMYKQFEDLFWIRRGWNWIRIYKGRDRIENANSKANSFYNRYVLSGLFAKKMINRFIDDFHAEAKQRILDARKENIQVKTSDGHGSWIDENVVEPKPMEKIIVKGKEDLLADIDKFIKSKEKYRRRDMLYKRGYLFKGTPGGGKTSFIMSLAKRIDRSVNFLQLNEMTDSAMRYAFRKLKPNSILVIEDIDAAFVQRDGEDQTFFSFSTLLNCLDGVFATEDIIVIFTTNHPEKLDPALIRNGRVDYIMEFAQPEPEQVIKYIETFFEIDNVVLPSGYTCSLPMCDIQDACITFDEDPEKAIERIMLQDQITNDTGKRANQDELRTKYESKNSKIKETAPNDVEVKLTEN